jgi:vWA domain found in the FtsH ternary systems/N-terminal helical region fused to the FtsH ternary system vWA domain
MDIVVLRESEEAQQFLLQGLWLQRVAHPHAVTVKPILEWALEIAGGGQPLPPLGLVADFGHAAFGIDREQKSRTENIPVAGLPPGLMRTYEDHLLGKLYADWTFERAADALRRFQGRDRAKGLAYVIRQFRDRASLGGIELSPGVIRGLNDLTPDELLRRGWESLSNNGLMPAIVRQYEASIAAARRMAEVLALEDVIALEQRTALADLGQYVAHRQILQVAARLEASLPKHKVKPLATRQEVPTRVLDEDTYPVGGFSSISNKGSIESLLHSQLAYIEPDPEDRPDLFDVKFVRDELYYYSRDENQFLRRRRTFLFLLHADLVRARFKDPELPVQRIVMVLGLLTSAVRKLSEWLSTDAIHFEFLLIPEAVQKGTASTGKPLAHEAELLEMLFREQIENGTVAVRIFPNTIDADISAYADRLADRSLCQVLSVGVDAAEPKCDSAVVSSLKIDGPRAELRYGRFDAAIPEGDDPFDSWAALLERLLSLWV